MNDRDPDAATPLERGLPTPPEDTSPPHDGLLLPLIHELIQPYVERARAHGPIPPLRSDDWLDAHPDQQIAHLLIMGAANAISAPHQVVRAVLYRAESDIRAHPDHQDYNPGPSHAEIRARRYPWLAPGQRPGHDLAGDGTIDRRSA